MSKYYIFGHESQKQLKNEKEFYLYFFLLSFGNFALISK